MSFLYACFPSACKAILPEPQSPVIGGDGQNSVHGSIKLIRIMTTRAPSAMKIEASFNETVHFHVLYE